MPKYINADALTAELNDMDGMIYSDLADILADAPSADVAPVRRGEWIAEQKSAEYCEFRCSICDYSIGETDQFDETEVKQFSEWYKYCPLCGANMTGESSTKGKEEHHEAD